MTEETLVAATTEIPADQTNETPEVVTPEPAEQTEPQASDKDERDKAIARMERRINRKHAEAAAANERVRMLEERLAGFEKQQPAEKIEVDPSELEKTVIERAREIARAERFTEQCNAVAAKGRQEFPDFQDAVASVATEIPLFDRRGGPTPAMQVMLEADNPPALLHYLGKNPDVVSELADLSPTQIARRLDRIEREMSQKPKTSQAPKPLEPISAKAVSKDPSEMTDKEFAEWRKRSIAQRR